MRLPTLLLACGVAAASLLPSTFVGTWVGTPDVSPLGPFDEKFQFTIGQAADGTGWLMRDFWAPDSDVIPGSAQRFFVDNTTGYVTYCGAIDNFFSTTANGTVQKLLAPQGTWSDTAIGWCDASYGCNSIQVPCGPLSLVGRVGVGGGLPSGRPSPRPKGQFSFSACSGRSSSPTPTR